MANNLPLEGKLNSYEKRGSFHHFGFMRHTLFNKCAVERKELTDSIMSIFQPGSSGDLPARQV
jgi:hypothetical protein